MLGLPFINLNDILGNVCHNRSQTFRSVVHVVLQCSILTVQERRKGIINLAFSHQMLQIRSYKQVG